MEHAILTPDEAAAYLRVAVSTLKAWRQRNFGPEQPPLISNDIHNSEPRYTAMLGYACAAFGRIGTGPGPDAIAGGAA